MKIAIGIVTYKTPKKDLRKWITSLKSSISRINDSLEIPDFEIFTIDNSNEKVKIPTKLNVHSLSSRGNIGYTKAINLLINQSIYKLGFDYFLTANPDGVFHPDFFNNLIPFIHRFPNTVIESIQFPEEHLKKYDPITLDVPWASGCCTLYPASVLNKVGLMDEEFFMYIEDVDFSWRCRLDGISVKICPGAKYGHYTLNRPHLNTTEKFMFDSGRYFAHKWGNKEFLTFCEEELIKRKIYKQKKEFKKLPKANRKFRSKKASSITNFNNLFYFSEPRW